MKKSSVIESGRSNFSDDPERFKIIRLKTGDTVLAELDEGLVDFGYNPTVELINPVCVQTANIQANPTNGHVSSELFVWRPFLPFTKSTRLPIASDIILTMGTMDHVAYKSYTLYIREMEERREVARCEQAVIDVMQGALEDAGGTNLAVVDSDEVHKVQPPEPIIIDLNVRYPDPPQE